MELTTPRRSELLKTLLAQQVQPQPNIRSGGELLAKLLAQGVRQAQINRLRKEEAASKKTEQANVAQVLSKLGGDPADMNFMDNPITDGSGTNMFGQPTLGRPQNNISMAQALGQLPVDNPVASAISGQMIQRAFAPDPVPKAPTTRTRQSGDMNVTEEWDAANQKWVRVSEGPRTKPGLTTNIYNTLPGEENTKPTTNKIEEILLNSNAEIAILEPLIEGFDEDFLNFKGDLQAFFLKKGDYLGANLTDSQKQFLTDRSTYMASAAEGLNVYINTLSGAAVSPEEAVRLLKGFPDPDGDEPTVFFAKLQNRYRQTKLAVARAKLAKELGVVGIDNIAGLSTLNDKAFKSSLNRAAGQWYDAAIASGQSEEEAKQFAQDRTRRILTIGNSVLEL